MRSVKSCFNPTLFRKNITRFWPVWGVYLLLWLLTLPLQLLSTADYRPNLVFTLFPFGVGMAIFFGLLSVMAVFSYLYNSRSVQLMHALPVTREGLFLTNYLSGLAFLLVPNVLVFLLSLPAGGASYRGVLLLWLAVQSLVSLFFYSFAVFCAMFTGNLLALPFFYGILNWLVMGVIAVVNSLLQEVLFGFWGTTWMDTVALWLTPPVMLIQAVAFHTTPEEVYYLNDLPAILLYGLAGILLAAAALLVYRRRRLETAGDVVSVRLMRPVFKYGVAFCAAVVVGTWFYQTFRSLFPRGAWVILLSLLVWGAAGYFVAEILLRKTFRVLARSWKGLAAFSLALAAVFTFTNLDLFGFNRAPVRSEVVSVSVSGLNTMPYDAASSGFFTLTDPADIDAVLQLHGVIAASKNVLRAELARMDSGSNWTDRPRPDGKMASLQQTATTNLTLLYDLADGRAIRRQYTLPVRADDLTVPGSVTALLDAFANRPASVAQSYWGGLIERASLVYTSLDVYNSATQSYETVEIRNQANRDRLLAAVQADMAAARIGRRYLLATAERMENCYYNDLDFTFFVPKSNLGPNAAEDWSRTVKVTLQATATETLKVLAELGYSGDQLVTYGDSVQAGR